jgi:hypothetical protein
MGNPYLEKGDKLEQVVELIERAIINSNPSLRASNFKIDPKKIIMDNGVRYEIDLYVEIDQGFGYKGIFIFECKNWESNVSTDEITKFSDKINVTKAQHGFFVAKKYSSSAESKAKQDKRITLLYVDDNPIDPSSFIKFQFFNKINNILSVEFIGFGVIDKEKSQKKIIDFENSKIKYKEQEGMLKDFLTNLIEDIWGSKMQEEGLNDLPDGNYSFESEKEFTFQRGDLFVEELSYERDIEKVKVRVRFEGEVIHPKIISKIDVLTRGRVIQYEAVKTSAGVEITFGLVAINSPK